MRRPSLAALAPTLAVALAAGPLWSWWSETAAPFVAPLPSVAGVLALLAGFRLLLAPLAEASSWMAASLDRHASDVPAGTSGSAVSSRKRPPGNR